MRTKPARELPAPLQAARRQFDQWRASHLGRRRIPETLWDVAVKVARQYGINRTADTLRLDYYRLKQRVVASYETTPTPPSSVPTFVELPALPAPATRGCVIELEDRSGSKMRIETPSVPATDLVALARSFWGT